MGFPGYSVKKRKKATGMGLYLAKEMAKELNISLHVTSEWNKGFEIEISFPVIDSISDSNQAPSD